MEGRRGRRRDWAALALLLLALAAAPSVGAAGAKGRAGPRLAPCGPRHFVPDTTRRPEGIQAFFSRRSYAPGDVATLHVVSAPAGVVLRIFHADVKHPPSSRPGAMTGVPVGAPVRV